MEREHTKYTCCFFGHRKIVETTELIEKLTNTIENLIIKKSVDTFLFGSKSEFDSLCLKVVTALKGKYPHIKRVYVRASFPDINDSYEKYLLECYEETYYPENMRGAGKASYVKRNQEMINNSEFCIVYYDENYTVPISRNAKRNLTNKQPKSGTKIAYNYAVKKKCKIMNIIRSKKNV